jgi:hypothetical protein
MSSTLLQQLLARDPRKLAHFPEPPLDRALSDWHRLLNTPPAPNPASAAPAPELGQAYAELATHVWRTRHRLSDAPPDLLRRALRHLDGATETLRQLDVTSKDWLNEPYDPGLPLKVIAFQPSPGLVRDTIIEVVRPAVYWQNRLVQSGEVVVGRSGVDS